MNLELFAPHSYLSAALGEVFVLPASEASFFIMSIWVLSLDRGKSIAMLTKATSEHRGEARTMVPDLVE